MSKLILSCGKEITLNEGQQYALEQIKKFLNDKKKKFFCLSGSAGSGKTTIAKSAIENYKGIVCVTAPTHKAVKVIRQATGIESVTLHSLLGLKPDMNLEEFSEKNLIFTACSGINGDSNVYDLVLIDEASMISSALLQLIKMRIKKVIFMGDPMQLPPVKESTSFVFNDTEIDVIKLTKVERQSGDNPLLGLYSIILKNIDSEVDRYEKTSKIDNGIGYDFITDKYRFVSAMRDSFTENRLENKIICYTNQRIAIWNSFIRRLISGLDSDSKIDHVSVGDILMGYRTIRKDKEVLIQNSLDYEVVSVSNGKKIYTIFYDNENREVQISGFWVVIKDIDSEIQKKIFIVSPEAYKDYLIEERRLTSEAKSAKSDRGQKWKRYFMFKDEFFILGNCDGCVKDLDFAYAITCHKSQGSTYENVFVDMADINRNQVSKERNRLKYVALSRPKKAAYIWGA